MAKLVIHAEADDEFQEAYLRYVARNRPVADRFKALVRQAFDRVAADPMRGTVYDAGHRFYSLKKFPHLVIYRYSPEADVATVVAVSHPSQDQSYWKNR